MDTEHTSPDESILDAESWAALPAILGRLPEPVVLVVWGEDKSSYEESQAVALCQALAEKFDTIRLRILPHRANYPYYPVIAVMGSSEVEELDHGVRLIGLPCGYQMTSLITAIQAVSFRAMTLEPITRIKLHRLVDEVADDIIVELMTSAEDEGGPLMAKIIFGMAVATSRLRSFLIMSDQFPEANNRYSVNYVPHTVINRRIHVQGVVDEDNVLRHIAAALRGR
jgi:alkyl hydroperoxide reductase subunit AhpF